MKTGWRILAVACMTGVAGCANQAPGNDATSATAWSTEAGRTLTPVMLVQSTTYDAQDHVVIVRVAAASGRADTGGQATLPQAHVQRPTGASNPQPAPRADTAAGEQALDVSNRDGILNFATATYPDRLVRYVRIVTVPNAGSGAGAQATRAPFMVQVPPEQVTAARQTPSGRTGSAPTPAAGAAALATNTMGATLPPGVTMDPNIVPMAQLGASTAAKAAAVLQVARSKLGTPYIWGHNEDRGQYGFDCSNFTAYVYHHALGYIISALSVVQNSSVGIRVPMTDLKPGDLLIFENGKHVGIYAGNHNMIDEGGGAGKVSYMTIGPGSYWGNHLTSVRRMF